MSVQRYSFTETEFGKAMKGDDNGYWVLYSSLAEREQRIAKLEAALRGLQWGLVQGKRCWCEAFLQADGYEHSQDCLEARAALATEGEKREA